MVFMVTYICNIFLAQLNEPLKPSSISFTLGREALHYVTISQRTGWPPPVTGLLLPLSDLWDMFPAIYISNPLHA